MSGTRVLRFGIAVLLVGAGLAYAGQGETTPKGPTPKEPLLPESVLKELASEAGNGGAAVNVKQTTPAPELQRRNPRYQIQKGDTLVLNFPLTPQFNETVTVEPDGYIGLIGSGDIHVEHLTLPELNEAVRTAYTDKKVLHDPIVTSTLESFVTPYFIAGGEVGKPGKYTLYGDTTLTQAVEIAGGFTTSSKHSQVMLFRRISDQWTEARVINVKKMLGARNLREDLLLQPGDMLFVPKNRLSKITPYLPYIVPTAWARIGIGFNGGVLY